MERVPEPRLDPPEPKAIATCPYCGEDVSEGDEAVEFDGCVYHVECFQDKAPSILLEMFGARKIVAGED